MRALSEIKGDEALDAFAELIEPLMLIATDEEVKKARSKPTWYMAKVILKNHKEPLKKVLAILSGEDPSTYQPSLFSLPMDLLTLLNDPEVQAVFTSQGQTETQKPTSTSGSASIEGTDH